MLPKLHLTKHTFTLKLLLQSPKRLVDVVITNRYLHVVVTTFLSLSCKEVAGARLIAPIVMLVQFCLKAGFSRANVAI